MVITRDRIMGSSDEALMHRFYAGETEALDELAHRFDPTLGRVAYQILWLRTGSEAQAAEWDVNDRLDAVWALVMMSRPASIGRWPYQRLTALTWMILLLGQEIDRHLGLRPPF